MLYNLEKDIDRKNFEFKVENMLKNKKQVELKERREKRSISANAYLHVCISMCAIEWGYTLEECKVLLKRECSFMVYYKNDKAFLKETRKMDSKELSDFVEWIINYAGRNNLFIPSSDDYLKNQFEIDKEINNHKQFL